MAHLAGVGGMTWAWNEGMRGQTNAICIILLKTEQEMSSVATPFSTFVGHFEPPLASDMTTEQDVYL